MNILLLGSGGREHAFAWKMSQSPLCTELFIAPGNAGTANYGQNIPIQVNDFEAIAEFTMTTKIDMVVVGPDDPLVEGVYDYLRGKPALKTLPIVGPSKAGALLEGSKAFSKQFMLRHKIPTAAYKEFDAQNLHEGDAYIDQQQAPIVLKADGLALGKGVLICEDKAEAKKELQEMIMHAKFGKASARVVIEQFLKGIEFSVFVLTDGITYKILPHAKDYKRIGEGDKGLNTGGMGCVSPLPFVDETMMQQVEEQIIKPTIAGLQKENIDYKGFIYFGLMNVEGKPWVIEYNCRMGDPETEVVFPRIKSDLVQHFVALCAGRLSDEKIEIDSRAAVTVIVASGGYPEKYEKGKPISGLEAVSESIVFQAGTKVADGQLQTNGGRVLAVTSLGDTMKEALQMSYASIEKIHFDGMYFRRDIGWEF